MSKWQTHFVIRIMPDQKLRLQPHHVTIVSTMNIWDSSSARIKWNKNPLHLNHYNFRTINAIDVLFSPLPISVS